MDERRVHLESWFGSLPMAASLNKDWSFTPVSGDASFRRYFRISHQDQSWIAVDSPPAKENNEDFIQISALLSEFCQVPHVFAYDKEQGFMLLSDLGDTLFYSALQNAPDNTSQTLYQHALGLLKNIQQCPHQNLRPYNSEFMTAEMRLFDEWFLQSFLQLSELEIDLNSLYERINQELSLQPKVFVHRDFHSRNIMLLDNGELGVIDFQDALSGPVTYDLVSLLKDCYVASPRSETLSLVESYHQMSIAAGLLDTDVSLADYIRWFDWMGIQRHLKVLGIFSRLFLRDSKANYLQDIPLTHAYLLEATAIYPELADLHALLDDKVAQALESHSMITLV